MKRILSICVFLVLAAASLAGHPSALKDGSPCCWETLFRQGSAECAPSGPTRGTVLYADGKLPRAKARVQSSVWKGKTFHCDGSFTNRWAGGVNAVSACTKIEPSCLDGQPCIVMQYPSDARVFSNVRDELRQICPGMWLGRSYDGCTGEPKNWFVLQSK